MYRNTKSKRAEALEGLKVLIRGPGCVKGQGETRVRAVSLAWHHFLR